jgi:hypothetical protein
LPKVTEPGGGMTETQGGPMPSMAVPARPLRVWFPPSKGWFSVREGTDENPPLPQSPSTQGGDSWGSQEARSSPGGREALINRSKLVPK